MLHLGDITKISGYTAPIVDCIVGGSPCQDLSIAGKRAGLDGERSGLFMDQVRIVKEMRDRDVRENGKSGVDVRPRYLVWENVPGAFSSNKGEDFRIVLEEIAKVKDKDAVIPRPDKWQTSGCIMGDGWSIAWRVLDAQFWGVPQRRRRIALVADFGGHSASEILFVSEGVSGHPQPSESERKATPSDAEGSTGANDKAYTMKIRSGCDVDAHGKSAGKGALIQTEKSGTLSCVQDQYLFQPVGCDVYNLALTDDKVCSLTAQGYGSTGTCPKVIEPVVALDRASYNQGQNAQFDFDVNDSGVASTIVAKGPSAVCYSFDHLSSNSMKSSNPHSGCHETNVARTIDTTYPDPSKNQGGVAVVHALGFDPSCSRDIGQYVHNNLGNTLTNGTCPGYHNGVAVVEKVYTIGNGQVDGTDLHEKAGTLNCMHDQQAVMIATRTRYTVRRLTPLECERLQGYPDGWTDIGEYIDSKGKKKQSSDAARYKALGNSIAIPPWKWVMKRLCACYERDATLASLFDGIGGFPYIWEQINGKGSCLWASEIEEFPMAVTKVRIGE